MIKKIVVFFISLIFITNTYIAEQVFTMYGFDGENSNRDWDKKQFFIRMEEISNVKFEFKQFNKYNEWLEYKNNIVSSNILPDVLFKASLTKTEQIELYKAGKLLNLEPLIKEYAPNFYKLMLENEEIKNSITLPNGEIVSLPTIHPYPSQNIMWINKNWLDNLNLTIPNDINTLESVLLAFKNNDPNSNNKADEIPLTFTSIWDLKFLSHGFGFISNDFNLYTENNNVIYSLFNNNYYNFISCLKNWYANELLDKEGFYQVINLQTNETKQEEASKYGIIIGPSPLSKVSLTQSKEYMALMPLKFNDRQIYSSLIDKSLSGSFAISSTCKDPKSVLKWIDYLYTEEGAKLAAFGKEGVDYTVFDDGTWDWADTSQEGLSNILTNSVISSSGFVPFYEPYEFQKKFDDSFAIYLMDELEKYFVYLIKPFPSVWLNLEENDYILNMQNNLGKYVDEALIRFIIGEYELSNENWNKFITSLDEYHIKEFIDFWQNKLINN